MSQSGSSCFLLQPLSEGGGGAASRRSVGTRNSLAQESGGQDDPKQTNETPSSSEGEKVEFPEIESVSIVPSSLFQPKRSHSILPLSGSTLRVRVPAECGRGGGRERGGGEGVRLLLSDLAAVCLVGMFNK